MSITPGMSSDTLLGRRLECETLDRLVAEVRAGQRPGVIFRQPLDRQLRQPRQLRARYPGGEDEPDGFGRQPPGRKSQRLRRGLVQPLLVVDHADQRPLPGHLRQQAQYRQRHQEPVRCRARADAEHGPQRVPLRTGEPLQVVQHRREQLMQPGEGQLHLRLTARHAHHPAALRLPGQVIQQRGLAHTRLAEHHQHLALPATTAATRPASTFASRLRPLSGTVCLCGAVRRCGERESVATAGADLHRVRGGGATHGGTMTSPEGKRRRAVMD